MQLSELSANGKVMANFFGKITNVQRTGPDESIIETSITIPSKDQYQHPTTYVVISKKRIGNPDEEVEVQVELYSRQFKDKNGLWRNNLTMYAVQ
jgi:hypothetical protein